MSSLTIEDFKIKGRKVGQAGTYPAIRELIKSEISAELDEDDGLFIGYGMFKDVLPYTQQDSYDGEVEELTFKSIVLENKYLKAVFLPEVGGRLWSLYDKENQRDLLLENTEFLPCNLAIRNAWVAGGTEFNCGRRGHDEQTCSPRFTAIIDGETPVVRFYEFQRDRNVPFQYDCFLPEDSKFLFIRGRIHNITTEVQPMYWWSNIALPEVKGSRIVTPALTTFANWYENGCHALAKLSLPFGEGFDGTYPVNFGYIKDHFYNIPEGQRPFECLFYPDGYGFCHASTMRLRGRKLFVWGQSQGGRHWNRRLLGENLDSYIEIQGGLGRSQQECLPMPPKTAWEWLEAYGALTVNPDDVFGDWEKAIASAQAQLDAALPQEKLEAMLKDTRESIALQAGKVVVKGSGWGALEEAKLGKKLAKHLDFGSTDKLQQDWLDLLNNKAMNDDAPISYMIGNDWLEMLKNATPSWKTYYHIALNYYRLADYERMSNALAEAEKLNGNMKYILHAKANLNLRLNKLEDAANNITTACKIDLNDISFVKESLKVLAAANAYNMILEIVDSLDEKYKKLPLIKFFKSMGFAYTGKLAEAEEILLEGGGFEIPDIREGENSATSLYIDIQKMKAQAAGLPFDPDACQVPFILDFRMSKDVASKVK